MIQRLQDRLREQAKILSANGRDPSMLHDGAADYIDLLEQSLRVAVDTLTVYASHNRHGPQAAQDALIELSIIAKAEMTPHPKRRPGGAA